MEKRRPTHDLSAIRALLGDAATLNLTATAFQDADDLGFGEADVAAVIAGLTPRMFYKSMNTYADPRVWQDVYHVPARDLMLYVKVQRDADGVYRLMSFKEL